MSKYDDPGEWLIGTCSETCGGLLFRDTDDAIWCPRCSRRQARKIMQEWRAILPKKGT